MLIHITEGQSPGFKYLNVFFPFLVVFRSRLEGQKLKRRINLLEQWSTETTTTTL